MDQLKATLFKAAYAAGKVIENFFNGTFTVSSKDRINNLVTEADIEAEKTIIEIIKNDFPDHNILSEEIGALPTSSPYLWIIDPIDGTVNFAHHIPICAVSIGLYFEGKPLLGVVYNPIMKEFFFAQKDGGAFLNDQPIHVSKKQEFEKACLVTGFPYKFPDSRRHPVDVFAKIVKLGLPVRRLGSAALDLCWVACGRFDGFWEYNLQPWDVAAGYLIVSEAGGQISNFSAKSIDAFEKETLATNGLIHEALRNMIIEG